MNQKLWSKVKIGKADECWEWQGRIAYDGYGMMGHAYAHRAAWEDTHGDIPKDMVVRHACDNRKCCNPNHLLIGTKKDNTQDAVRRGRLYVKHSQEMIDAIIQDYKDGMTQDQIAEKYELGQGYISRVVNGKLRYRSSDTNH